MARQRNHAITIEPTKQENHNIPLCMTFKIRKEATKKKKKKKKFCS